AGFVGDVGKSAIVIVMEKCASGLLAGKLHVHIRGIREVDIGPAVAIVIDQGHSATHRFHDVFLIWRGEMIEANSRRGSNIHQLGNQRSRRRSGGSSRFVRWSGALALLRVKAKSENRDSCDRSETRPDCAG